MPLLHIRMPSRLEQNKQHLPVSYHPFTIPPPLWHHETQAKVSQVLKSLVHTGKPYLHKARPSSLPSLLGSRMWFATINFANSAAVLAVLNTLVALPATIMWAYTTWRKKSSAAFMLSLGSRGTQERLITFFSWKRVPMFITDLGNTATAKQSAIHTKQL